MNPSLRPKLFSDLYESLQMRSTYRLHREGGFASTFKLLKICCSDHLQRCAAGISQCEAKKSPEII